MTVTFPNGYGTDLDTLDDVRRKHRHRYHPEAYRRIEAIMVASQGSLGLSEDQGLCGFGGGARTREEQAASYARRPDLFAPPDNSFHEEWRWADGEWGAQAVDWVGRDKRHEEAWRFLRERGGEFGLFTFWNVNGEPWHSQMVDVPTSVRRWVAAGKPGPGRWALPNTPAAPTPTPDYGLYPFNRAKPTIAEGERGDLVRYLQRVLSEKANQTGVTADGQFGPKTDEGVRNLQAFVKLRATGVVDGPTWDVIDALAGYVAPPVPIDPESSTPEGVRLTQNGLYYVRPGDSPWKAAERIWGNGRLWEEKGLLPESFAAPYRSAPIPNLPGRITNVKAGEGKFAVIHRMFPDRNQYELLARFSMFNGGSDRVLHAGDVVYLDDA